MKYKNPRSDFRIRELPPKVEAGKKGVVVNCPYCYPTHPILPGVISPCGTTLKVTAVQKYLSSHATKSIHCLKCGKTGGEMVTYRNGYVHLKECSPETKLLTEIPPLSRLAKIVYHSPAKIRKYLESHMGAVKELQEIDQEGKQTGVVLGYFFWKGK
jgi:hypothetical protein